MLYTVVPLDMVFSSELPKTEEETVGGARLIWQVDGSRRSLMRVISTDLRDYLKYRI